MFTRWATKQAMCVVAIAACSLVLSPETAWAWAWPADGSILRGFSVQDDQYAAGQHRGIDVALAGAPVGPRAGVRGGLVRRSGPDPRVDGHDRDVGRL